MNEYVVGLGVSGVLGWVVKWLLTEGKHTLDKQSDSQDKLAAALTELSKVIALQTSTLERIESKVDRMHNDVKDLKNEWGIR